MVRSLMEKLKCIMHTTTLFVLLICSSVRATGRQLIQDVATEDGTLQVAYRLQGGNVILNTPLASQQGNPNGLQFQLIRKESLNISESGQTSRSTDRYTRLLERLRKDQARVHSLKRIITLVTRRSSNGSNADTELDWSSPVSSAFSLGDDEYLIQLGVGTPTNNQYYMIIDTGSDISWLQCANCSYCYPQVGPVFNPASSSSYQPISCESPTCTQLEGAECQSDRCQYMVGYGDGSFTTGDLAMETFSSGSGVIEHIIFGCGHDNEGLFRGTAGLVGLGGGSMSFTSQLAGSYGRKFSYCLVNENSPLNSSSSLIFGADAFPSTAVTTPLILNSRMPTFYYASVTDISINNVALNINASKLQLTSSGSGGVIIDSGTTVTRLESSIYSDLRDAFLNAAKSLQRAREFSLFDTCFDLSGNETSSIPTVSFHFQGGATMDLPSSNTLVEVDDAGTFCLAFAESKFDLSIIGNIQQQTFRIGFDRDNGLLSVTSSQCK